MRIFWNLALPFAATSVAALLLYAIFHVFGPPLGDSVKLNLSWGHEFTTQFLAGDLYPRWLFGLHQGAGSPVFYFYGPFPFWINAIFGEVFCAGGGSEYCLMIGPCVLIALSGIGFFYWARLYARPPAALLAAIVYMFLPYHLAIDLWYRSALGEFAAYVWMPVILLGLAKASASSGYRILAAVGYAGLLYSHLPSALLFSPVMALFALIEYGFSRALQVLVVPVVLGIGLAALYLVPALTTQEYISAWVWWSGELYDASNWLWLDGRDAPSIFAGFVLFALLIPTILGLIMAAGVIAEGKGGSRINTFIFVAMGYAWFLMTYPSVFLWEHASVLKMVQFPWRLGIVVDLCVATLFAVWIESTLARRRYFALTLCLTATLFGIFYYKNAENMHDYLLEVAPAKYVEAVRDQVSLGLDATEYRTAWLTRYTGALDFQTLAEELGNTPEMSVVSGEGTARIVQKEYDRLSIVVEAKVPVLVRFRRFYYPGWVLKEEADGREFEIHASTVLGLLEARIPSGTYRLVLTREPIREERIGAIVSIASLVVCLLLLARIRWRRVSLTGGGNPFGRTPSPRGNIR